MPAMSPSTWHTTPAVCVYLRNSALSIELHVLRKHLMHLLTTIYSMMLSDCSNIQNLMSYVKIDHAYIYLTDLTKKKIEKNIIENQTLGS